MGRSKITAIRSEKDGKPTYTSARLNCRHQFQYGRIEIRAKIPEHKGNGVWPAIWMLSEGFANKVRWPLCGEIDLMGVRQL